MQHPINPARAAVEQARRQLHMPGQQGLHLLGRHLLQRQIEIGLPPLVAQARPVQILAQLIHPSDELSDALMAAGAHGQHRQPEGLTEPIGIDGYPEAARLVAPVHGYHQQRIR